MEKKLICIVCPVGCRLMITGSIDDEKAEELKISGNKCKKGIDYAHNEIKNPLRMVCTTARIKGGIHSVIPVKTDRAIPEKYKLEVVKAVNCIELKSPVKMGDIIIPDLFGTGVNIVADRDM